MSRVLTLRLPEEDADKVEEVARVKGVSVAEIVRQGVLSYVARVRQEPGYSEELLELVDQLRREAEALRVRASPSAQSKDRSQ
jgi:hypothetical protein